MNPSDAVPIERELGGLREWRRTEWVAEPGPQIAVGEQVEAQHRDQIRQSPSEGGTKLQVPQREDGDQSCPDLDVQSIRGGSDEGLDAQVLLDRFEERLYLPSLFIDSGDGGRSEGQMVGEELVDPTVLSTILDKAQKW